MATRGFASDLHVLPSSSVEWIQVRDERSVIALWIGKCHAFAPRPTGSDSAYAREERLTLQGTINAKPTVPLDLANCWPCNRPTCVRGFLSKFQCGTSFNWPIAGSPCALNAESNRAAGLAAEILENV
jgi:hypothetical protein